MIATPDLSNVRTVKDVADTITSGCDCIKELSTVVAETKGIKLDPVIPEAVLIEIVYRPTALMVRLLMLYLFLITYDKVHVPPVELP